MDGDPAIKIKHPNVLNKYRKMISRTCLFFSDFYRARKHCACRAEMWKEKDKFISVLHCACHFLFSPPLRFAPMLRKLHMQNSTAVDDLRCGTKHWNMYLECKCGKSYVRIGLSCRNIHSYGIKIAVHCCEPSRCNTTKKTRRAQMISLGNWRDKSIQLQN